MSINSLGSAESSNPAAWITLASGTTLQELEWCDEAADPDEDGEFDFETVRLPRMRFSIWETKTSLEIGEPKASITAT